jgi:hypothetical protein
MMGWIVPIGARDTAILPLDEMIKSESPNATDLGAARRRLPGELSADGTWTWLSLGPGPRESDSRRSGEGNALTTGID